MTLTIIKLIFCLYGLHIVFSAFVTLILVLGNPAKRLSVLRTTIVIPFSFILNFGLFLFFIWRRFDLHSLKALFVNFLSGNFLYQDIEYLSVVGLICAFASIFFGIYFCWLIFDKSIQLEKFQENSMFVVLAAALFFVAVGFYTADYSKTHILIETVHADQSYVHEDGISTTEDFVLLQNQGVFPVNLNGLYLSDNSEKLDKLKFSDMLIAPGEVSRILLDETAPFGIGDGETVYLSDDHTILSAYSYHANAGVSLREPVFSEPSGFYADAFDLYIEGEEGTTIYYTLDGSRPSEDSFVYDGTPIYVYDQKGEYCPCHEVKEVVRNYLEYKPETDNVDRIFIIRAIAMRDDGEKSPETVAAYMIGNDYYADKKIISLTADYDDLFSDTGICTTGAAYNAWYEGGMIGDVPPINFLQSGRNWEIEGNLLYFDDSIFKGEQDVGIRVFGGASREEAKKRFSIYSRKTYSGSNSFAMDFFGDGRPVHAVALRSNVFDAVLQDIPINRNVTTQSHTNAFVFLNGELWYDTFICEKYNSYYFFEHEGITDNNIVMVKAGEISEGKEEDLLLYQEIYNYLGEHSLSDEEYYEEFCRLIDVQSYIDYACINLYTCNLDQDEIKNRILYRARIPVEENGPNDGKWRWCLYDMDAFEWISGKAEYYGVSEFAAINSFKAEPTTAGASFENQTLFKALMQSESFRYQFFTTFEDMIQNDFAPAHVKEVLDKYGIHDESVNEFFEHRPEYMRKYLYEQMGLEYEAMQ